MTERLPRLVALALSMFVALPAVLLLFVILRFGVDVPFWDHWAIAAMLRKIESGTLALSDLTALHNESRMFFPHLLFLGLAYLTGWNTRVEMLVGFAIAVATFGNLALLTRATIDGPLTRTLAMLVPTSLLLFGIVQWENWLWGFDLVNLIPMLVLSAALAVACSRLGVRKQIALCIALATIGTFSSFSGILAWGLLPPVLLVRNRERINSFRRLAAVWTLAAAVNLLLFFTGYVRPSRASSLSEVFEHPGRALHYFLTFLGSPLGIGLPRPVEASALVGVVLCALLAVCCASLVRRKAEDLLRASTPWLALAAHSLLSAALATLGRSSLGPVQALASRYTTASIPLTVALLFLVFVQLRGSSRATRVLVPFTVAVATLHVLASIAAWPAIHSRYKLCLTGKGALALVRVVPELHLLSRANYEITSTILENVDSLDRQGLLHPPLVRTDRVRELAAPASERSAGKLEGLNRSGGLILASGWAVLPERGEPADLVLLCFRTPAGEDRIFAAGAVMSPHLEALAHGGSGTLLSGWALRVPVSRLPDDAVGVSAWAFNALDNRAQPLEGFAAIRRPAQQQRRRRRSPAADGSSRRSVLSMTGPRRERR